MESWPFGFVKLADKGVSGYDEAKELYSLVFGKGLRFLTLSFREEWAESQARLDAIAREGADATIAELGGKGILEALNVAHADYGRVLGITTQVEEAPAPEIRDRTLQAARTMREYVLKVVAHEEPDNPETTAMVDELLMPLVTWSDQASGSTQTLGESETPVGDEAAGTPDSGASATELPAVA